jgi:hypothetical protein
MKPRKFLKGQIAVIMTLAMATLLGAMALGTDVAILYFNWVQLQKAADSAVLSGALYLTGNSSSDTKVENTVTEVVTQNGVSSSEIVAGPTVGADQYSVSVKLQRTVPYYFAKVLGLDQGVVAAYSAAKLAQNQATRGVTPIGLECPTGEWNGTCGGAYAYNTTQVYSLSFKGSSSTGTIWSPGNWGALALGQGGTSTFEQNVTNGYGGLVYNNGSLSVDTQTGNGAPTHFDTAFEARLPCGSWSCAETSPPEGVDSSNPQTIVVPVVDFNQQTGKSTLTVEGFAEMFVVPPGTDGCTGDICAFFIQALADPGVVTDTTTCSKTSTVNACTPVLTD